MSVSKSGFQQSNVLTGSLVSDDLGLSRLDAGRIFPTFGVKEINPANLITGEVALERRP